MKQENTNWDDDWRVRITCVITHKVMEGLVWISFIVSVAYSLTHCNVSAKLKDPIASFNVQDGQVTYEEVDE